MIVDRRLVLAAVACLAIGWWFGGQSANPFAPQADRPVLRWIAKAAKGLLWIALVAEKPPQHNDRHLVHARPVGEDGYQMVDHGQGW
jgi:hypothetical protein